MASPHLTLLVGLKAEDLERWVGGGGWGFLQVDQHIEVCCYLANKLKEFIGLVDVFSFSFLGLPQCKYVYMFYAGADIPPNIYISISIGVLAIALLDMHS